MNQWTSDELNQIGNADELEIMSLRGSGTLRKPVPIWVVRVGDDLYVRAYKGRSGPWFQGTQERHAGAIRAGGIYKEVNFVEEAAAGINDQIDSAYRSKYHAYDAQYLDPMVTADARAATIKLVPR